MKITKIDTYLVNLGHRNIPYVKVHTDEDIYGVGEAYSCGPDKATVEVIHDFEEWLLGRDPRDIEGLWQLMYAGSRFPGGSVVNAAISGIEHALWDIAGKAANLPVYRLLGGKCRERVRVYQSPRGNSPQEIADNAVRLIEKYGYTAIKMSPLPGNWHTLPWNQALRETEARVAAVRDAVGPDIDIGLDP
ncbi:MAG: galactonate dehydratase, partial [Chloroflexi bacterium]